MKYDVQVEIYGIEADSQDDAEDRLRFAIGPYVTDFYIQQIYAVETEEAE